MNLKNKKCLVWDNGLFVSLAVTLSKSFGKALYYCPWVTGFPTSQLQMIGVGVTGIDRVESPWPHIDDVDLFVFPDVYEADIQTYLVGLGKRVWGCRSGAELEIDRGKSKKISAGLGIDIGPYKVMTGVDELRAHLQKHDDQFVKISKTRGDMETFHAAKYDTVAPKLTELEYRLGAKKDLMQFIVEDNTGPAVEIGYDGYAIDGQYAKQCLIGVEAKDTAYVARQMAYAKIPASVKSVNAKLAPQLKKYQYRGFLSTEIRDTEDGHAYLIDPCARLGSPPGELYQLIVENLGEILWHGAEGILIEPEFAGEWGAELILKSDAVAENWVKVTVPKEYEQNVKLRYYTEHDGSSYVIPQANKMTFLGAVVTYGDTAEEAIEQCKDIAKTVDALEIDSNPAALDDAVTDLQKIIGPPAAPPSRFQSMVDELLHSGKISQRAYDRLIEEHSA